MRYEDLAADIYRETERVLTFFGLEMNERVDNFLATHTSSDIEDVWSTYRDTNRYGKSFNRIQSQTMEL